MLDVPHEHHPQTILVIIYKWKFLINAILRHIGMWDTT